MGEKRIEMEKLFNRVSHVNDCLDDTNARLDIGGTLHCRAVTSLWEMNRLVERFHLFGYIMQPFYYFWQRMCPKLNILRNIYFFFTGGTRRSYTSTEILGRIVRAGFKLQYVSGDDYGVLDVTATKVSDPLPRDRSVTLPIIVLKRKGKGGKLINVHKFRTMHSYANYIQDYAYQKDGLADGGKIKNDFRVSRYGKFLRRFWLDELPMIIDLFGGNMKLVGVRPISEHYFSLYSKEMQELRIKVKPGLLPPFYYEKKTPKLIEDVEASERRYIEAYLKHPFKTDLRYFFGTIYNIVFRGKRSK